MNVIFILSKNSTIIALADDNFYIYVKNIFHNEKKKESFIETRLLKILFAGIIRGSGVHLIDLLLVTTVSTTFNS